MLNKTFDNITQYQLGRVGIMHFQSELLINEALTNLFSGDLQNTQENVTLIGPYLFGFYYLLVYNGKYKNVIK